MKRVVKTVLRAVFRPDKNRQLLESQLTSGLWTRAFSGLLLLGLMFGLTSIIQAFSGNIPAIPLTLPLGLENYFVWQAVLFVPWLVLSWFLVSWLAGLTLGMFGAKKFSWRQLSAGLALGFYPFLFWLWLPHFFTSVLYLIGMSQKELVDLLSNPGWFQTVYISLVVIALFSGWLATCLTVSGRRWVKRGTGLLVSSLSYLVWVLFIFVLLR